MVLRWLGVLCVHLFGLWGFVGDELRDRPASEGHQAGQRERCKNERKYGEGKGHHGLRRCRYVGRMRYAIQAYLTAIVLNLKRMVRLLTGTSFRGRARAAV